MNMIKLNLPTFSALLFAASMNIAFGDSFTRGKNGELHKDPAITLDGAPVVKPPPHDGLGGGDTSKLAEFIKSRNRTDYQVTKEHFERLAQILKDRKSQSALPLIERGRSLLDQANQALSGEKVVSNRPILDQVEGVIMEMNRLSESQPGIETHAVPGSNQDSHLNSQPAQKSALIQATEIYNRVHDRVTRLGDQKETKDDPKSVALFNRILDMQDRTREALANGQADAAKDLALKSENLISEWHRNGDAPQVGNQTTASHTGELDRLKVKLDRATEIVAASKNEKASRILEKGMEHFERAQGSELEGQTSRSKIEMDIALKLAAKAVDIARSGQNH